MELSEQDIQEFRSKGYTDNDIAQAYNEVKSEEGGLQGSYSNVMNAKGQTNALMNTGYNSMFTQASQENMIKWQLELDSLLERIDHMLRGDKLKFQDGKMIWMVADDDNDRVFNDYGVNEIMRILSMYLNRNTILSNYDEKTINLKVYDFGCEMSDLIFLKYESMGLNNLEKRKLYPMLNRQLVDSVHSAYLRALNGGERLSLREARQVTQTEPLGQGVTVNTGQPMRTRGLFNPMRYIGGGKNY